MTPKPMFILSGQDVYEVIQLFLERKITSAPVVNPVGELLGVLSELNLVKAVVRHQINPDKTDKIGHHTELLDEAVLVSEDTHVKEIMGALIKAPSHRVIVTDEKKLLVGIISPKDLLQFLSGEAEKQGEKRATLNESRLKLEDQIQSLTTDLNKYRNIFEYSPYMMHSVDKEGRILMANKVMHKNLGYSSGELTGKTIYDLYPEDSHKHAMLGLHAIMQKGFHELTATSLVKKDGSILAVDVCSSAIKDESGSFWGTISVSRPLEQRQMEATVEKLSQSG